MGLITRNYGMLNSGARILSVALISLKPKISIVAHHYLVGKLSYVA